MEESKKEISVQSCLSPKIGVNLDDMSTDIRTDIPFHRDPERISKGNETKGNIQKISKI